MTLEALWVNYLYSKMIGHEILLFCVTVDENNNDIVTNSIKTIFGEHRVNSIRYQYHWAFPSTSSSGECCSPQRLHILGYHVIAAGVDVLPIVVFPGHHGAHEECLGNVVGDAEDAQTEVVTPKAQRASDPSAPAQTEALRRGGGKGTRD